MTGLTFEITGARPDRTALAPVLNLALRIDCPGEQVQSMLLRCQVRIEPSRRRYDRAEQERLHDLFGDVERWGETLNAFQFAHVTLPVGSFTGTHQVDLPIELSYDLEVTAGKYLHSLEDGEVPLLALFSGTLFLADGAGVQVQPIPWELEARYRLPVSQWDELMDLHFPGSGWLRLGRDTIDALQAYKTRHALATWDDTMRHLVAARQAAP